MNAASLIHTETVVYDMMFVAHDRHSLLSRIQAWKYFLQSKQIKTTVIQEYLSFDLIALVYACLEQSVTIFTASKSKAETSDLSQLVDAVFIGSGCGYLYDNQGDNYHWIHEVIGDHSNHIYRPTDIDPDFLFVVGTTSGSDTGKPKVIKHSARTFLAAARCCTFFFDPNARFAAYPNINHIGMAANMVISPTLAGAKIYSVSSIFDLMVLSTRHCINTLGLFSTQASSWNLICEILAHEGIDWFSVDLTGIDLLTGGSPLGTSMADWFFAKNGRRIRSLFGNNEVLMPVFYHDVYNAQEDFLARNLGRPCPGVEYRIDNNNHLWLRTPSISEFIDVDEHGFFNTKDIVVQKNQVTSYKGRRLINGNFVTDLHDTILNVLCRDQIHMDHYTINHDAVTNKITFVFDRRSVQRSLLQYQQDISEILTQFDCDPEFQMLFSRDTDKIKTVLPRDENLIVYRSTRDYT